MKKTESPNFKDLELIPVSKPAIAHDADDFVEQVAATLNYAVPAASARGLKLLQTLSRLDTLVISDESVRKYTNAVRTTDTEAWNKTRRWQIRTWIAFSIFLVISLLYHGDYRWLPIGITVALGFISFLFFAIISGSTDWRTMPIENYTGVQPRFEVLEKVLVIKRALPEASIRIVFYSTIDPSQGPEIIHYGRALFLQVSYGNALYTVATWIGGNVLL